MNVKPWVVAGLLVMLFGCAAKQEPFEDELYDGRAVESFQLKDAPKTEKQAIERGDKALNQGKIDLALYEYIRSLRLPKGQFKDKTLYTIGRIHQSRKNVALAEKAYLMALKVNPDNVQVLEQLGADYSKQGETDKGKSYFIRAINSDLQRLSDSGEQFSPSMSPEMIDTLSVDDKSPALAYMGLGVLYDVDRSHLLAQALFRRALTIDPKSVKGLINMGYSYYMSGHYDEAERTMLAALQLSKNNKKAENNLALIYLAEGKELKALAMFKTHMSEPQALNNLGYFLILQGKPEAAVPYLQQAIDKNPLYYKIANENLERALSDIRMNADKKAEK